MAGAGLGLNARDLAVATFAAGEPVFRKGDAGNKACLVIQGEVTISLPYAGGQPTVLGKVSKGKIFGEIGVLNGARRTADAIAAIATRCAVIDGEVLARRLKTLDPFIRFWIEFMSERLVYMSKRASG